MADKKVKYSQSKEATKNKGKATFKKEWDKVSPEVKMYLKHGKDFPGFDQARRIRGGLAGGGISQRGLGRAFKKGGKV